MCLWDRLTFFNYCVWQPPRQPQDCSNRVSASYTVLRHDMYSDECSPVPQSCQPAALPRPVLKRWQVMWPNHNTKTGRGCGQESQVFYHSCQIKLDYLTFDNNLTRITPCIS